jgi:hypothetical protein
MAERAGTAADGHRAAAAGAGQEGQLGAGAGRRDRQRIRQERAQLRGTPRGM